MLWLNETDGIDVPDGIKNSGGVDSFIFSLDLFLDTIDDNSAVIKKAYDERIKLNYDIYNLLYTEQTNKEYYTDWIKEYVESQSKNKQ